MADHATTTTTPPTKATTHPPLPPKNPSWLVPISLHWMPHNTIVEPKLMFEYTTPSASDEDEDDDGTNEPPNDPRFGPNATLIIPYGGLDCFNNNALEKTFSKWELPGLWMMLAQIQLLIVNNYPLPPVMMEEPYSPQSMFRTQKSGLINLLTWCCYSYAKSHIGAAPPAVAIKTVKDTWGERAKRDGIRLWHTQFASTVTSPLSWIRLKLQN